MKPPAAATSILLAAVALVAHPMTTAEGGIKRVPVGQGQAIQPGDHLYRKGKQGKRKVIPTRASEVRRAPLAGREARLPRQARVSQTQPATIAEALPVEILEVEIHDHPMAGLGSETAVAARPRPAEQAIPVPEADAVEDSPVYRLTEEAHEQRRPAPKPAP